MVETTHPNETVIETLRRLKIISPENVELFAPGTRDVRNVKVFRDRVSRVIYLDGYRTADDVYQSGAYRRNTAAMVPDGQYDFEDLIDTERRFASYRQFIVGKKICDFGCGAGSFLRRASIYCHESIGVELQDDFRDSLRRGGIPCVDDLGSVPSSLDTVFLFHSLEHLYRPLNVLQRLRSRLKHSGQAHIVVEVPHACDFLIEGLSLQEFVDFTLWSQHLVLHTRQSLTALLSDAGFRSVVIHGVQRYGLANHLHWVRHKKPAGHKSMLSVIETPTLAGAYADALARLDANDTLVAIATT